MVKESLMQGPSLGVVIWMQRVTVQHLNPPMVNLFLWITLKGPRGTEQHQRSLMVDPFIREALMMERVTEQHIKPLMLESYLKMALNRQQNPLPDLSLGVGLKTGKVVYQQLRSSSPGPSLTQV